MKDKYVFDSSIWIELQRRNHTILQKAVPLLQGNCICLVDVIIAEVLRGARTEKDYLLLESAFNDFPCVSTTWQSVSLLAFKVAKKGFSPPLIDLYIAQAVSEGGRTIITQDQHFLHIAKVTPLEVEFWG